MNFPAALSYTSDHEWFKLEDDGTATVGITDFAQHELGDIVFIDITTVGQTLTRGEVFGSVEAVKTVSDLFLPVDGEVLEINPEVEKSPELVNTEPYERGWLIKLKVADASQLTGLLSVDAYKELIGE